MFLLVLVLASEPALDSVDSVQVLLPLVDSATLEIRATKDLATLRVVGVATTKVEASADKVRVAGAIRVLTPTKVKAVLEDLEVRAKVASEVRDKDKVVGAVRDKDKAVGVTKAAKAGVAKVKARETLDLLRAAGATGVKDPKTLREVVSLISSV